MGLGLCFAAPRPGGQNHLVGPLLAQRTSGGLKMGRWQGQDWKHVQSLLGVRGNLENAGPWD